MTMGNSFSVISSIMLRSASAIRSVVMIRPTSFLSERFFHIVLFFLAPFYVFGADTFFKSIQRLHIRKRATLFNRKQALSLTCIVLAIIYLFKVGFVYEIAGDVPSSIPLSIGRLKAYSDIEIRAIFYDEYTSEQEASSAIWLSKVIGENAKIYGDFGAKMHVLPVYGMIPEERVHVLSNGTMTGSGATIYLRYINVHGAVRYGLKYGQAYGAERDIAIELISGKSKIYSNGYSEIYRS